MNPLEIFESCPGLKKWTLCARRELGEDSGHLRLPRRREATARRTISVKRVFILVFRTAFHLTGPKAETMAKR
jgi:hypothetical protein